MLERRRVVVTGLGLICPLGSSLDKAWNALLAGQSGIKTIEYAGIESPSKIAGLVPDFNPADYGISSKDERKMDPFIQFGLAASVQAMNHSGLANHLSQLELERCGVAIGSGIGGLTFIQKNIEIMNQSGDERLACS